MPLATVPGQYATSGTCVPASIVLPFAPQTPRAPAFDVILRCVPLSDVNTSPRSSSCSSGVGPPAAWWLQPGSVDSSRRDRLERLCRYVCRPPLCLARVRQTWDGQVACSFRKPWRNGVAGVRLDPLTFLSRLAALVPPPRAHQVTYHGVLAPASPYRSQVVPEAAEEESTEPGCGHPAAGGPTPAERLARRLFRRHQGGTRRRYYPWAELMKRVFAADVLVCDTCGGRRKVLTFLTDPAVIRRILAHLGLATELPPVARARPPPVGLPLG